MLKSKILVDGSSVLGNIADTNGGGISLSRSAHITLSNSTIATNAATAGYGGGVRAEFLFEKI